MGPFSGAVTIRSAGIQEKCETESFVLKRCM